MPLVLNNPESSDKVRTNFLNNAGTLSGESSHGDIVPIYIPMQGFSYGLRMSLHPMSNHGDTTSNCSIGIQPRHHVPSPHAGRHLYPVL